MKKINTKTIDDKFQPPKYILHDLIDLIFLNARVIAYSSAFQERLTFPSYVEVNNFIADSMKQCFQEKSKLSKTSLEKVIDEQKSIMLKELYPKNHREIFEIARELITNMNPYHENAATFLHKACIYLITVGPDYDEWAEEKKLNFIITKKTLTMKAHEAIGYWTAKLETKKTNKKNVQTRTILKKARKATLKKWLETMTPDECRLKAPELGIKDRTYLSYIQELNEEKNEMIRNAKTTLLRKNDVSAKH